METPFCLQAFPSSLSVLRRHDSFLSCSAGSEGWRGLFVCTYEYSFPSWLLDQENNWPEQLCCEFLTAEGGTALYSRNWFFLVENVQERIPVGLVFNGILSLGSYEISTWTVSEGQKDMSKL